MPDWTRAAICGDLDRRRPRPERRATEVANESAATGEVIYLTRDGRRPAAIVPVEVAAGIEDADGIAAAQAAMAEPGEDIPAEGSGPS